MDLNVQNQMKNQHLVENWKLEHFLLDINFAESETEKIAWDQCHTNH